MNNTIDREQFADLLYKIQYNNHANPKEVKELFSPMREWIKTNIPDKLYRFRQISIRFGSAMHSPTQLVHFIFNCYHQNLYLSILYFAFCIF